MSSFTTPLDYQSTGLEWQGRPVVRLTAPFSYAIGEKRSGLAVVVPTGFITDLASIPPLLRRLMKPDGKYAKAAVIHDWMYVRGGLPRQTADRIFLEAMGVLNVPGWQRSLIYTAVRLFGSRSYGRRARQVTGWEFDAERGWLIVHHRGEVSWEELQAVKSEVMGPGQVAVEVFPEENKVINNGPERHLWRVPENAWRPCLKTVLADIAPMRDEYSRT